MRKILSKIEMDILLINILSIILILIAFSPSETIFFKVFRAIVAFFFIMLFPGYILLKICFSEKELNTFERIALSFGSSMLIVPILGLTLTCIFSKISYYSSIFAIYFFILVTSVIGQLFPKYSVKKNIFILNSKSINLVLAFTLVTLFGVIIRFYPAIDLSTFGGVWMPGNHLYPIYYTLHTGKLLERGALDTPTLYSRTIYNDLHNKANILFQPFYFLISGLTNLNEFLYLNKFFPIYGALLFPLSALLVANRIWKIQQKRVPVYYNLFVYLVANFATHKILMDSRFMLNNLVIGYSMMLFTVYFLLDEKNPKSKLFGILFGVFIFLYYYTAGLVFLVILISFLIIQIIKKKYIISISYIVLYCTSFVAYYIYLAEVTFRSYIVTLRESILAPGAMPGQLTLGRPLIELTIPCLSAYLNLFLVGFFILIFIFLWLTRKIERNNSNTFAVYLCIGLVSVGGMFFLWIGVKGLARLGAYVLVPFMLILASLLVAKQNSLRKMAIIISLLMVLTTIVAYTPGTLVHSNYLTYPEEYAIIWYCSHRCPNISENFVFTDGRIGTAPIMLNCFTFTGISGYTKRYPFEERALVDIFYGDNATNAVIALSYYKASFILLSKEMENFCVFSLNNNYKPLPTKSLIKFESSPYFGKIYDNGGAYYFLVLKPIRK